MVCIPYVSNLLLCDSICIYVCMLHSTSVCIYPVTFFYCVFSVTVSITRSVQFANLCNCSTHAWKPSLSLAFTLHRHSTFNAMYWPNTWICRIAQTGEFARQVFRVCHVILAPNLAIKAITPQEGITLEDETKMTDDFREQFKLHDPFL